jgi:hypothetical protein
MMLIGAFLKILDVSAHEKEAHEMTEMTMQSLCVFSPFHPFNH